MNWYRGAYWPGSWSPHVVPPHRQHEYYTGGDGDPYCAKCSQHRMLATTECPGRALRHEERAQSYMGGYDYFYGRWQHHAERRRMNDKRRDHQDDRLRGLVRRLHPELFTLQSPPARVSYPHLTNKPTYLNSAWMDLFDRYGENRWRSIADEIGERFVVRSGYRMTTLKDFADKLFPHQRDAISYMLARDDTYKSLPFEPSKKPFIVYHGNPVSERPWPLGYMMGASKHGALYWNRTAHEDLMDRWRKAVVGMDFGEAEARTIAWMTRGASHQWAPPKGVYISGCVVDYHGTATGRFKATGERKMSMSKDRVHFYANADKLGDRKYRNLLATAFGLTEREIPWSVPSQIVDGVVERQQFKIICRPSQFARFLIWRNEAGFTNDFKGLDAKLVPAETQPKEIDVSTRSVDY